MLDLKIVGMFCKNIPLPTDSTSVIALLISGVGSSKPAWMTLALAL